MRVIDLTRAFEPEMTVFPAKKAPLFEAAGTHEKDGYSETIIRLFTHTGTHVDPPRHMYADRTSLDQFPVSQFIGKALVIDARVAEEADGSEEKAITMKHLEPYGEKLEKADFLLFNTGWDAKWKDASYFEGYPCVDEEVLEYILAGSYKGIGSDTYSLDPMSPTEHPRHYKLFKTKDIINIENLCNLDKCGSKLFRFSCFPIKIKDSDGAAARAVAWFE